ncbi:hypothetical protein NN561_015145 [Cricetulus griseus]
MGAGVGRDRRRRSVSFPGRLRRRRRKRQPLLGRVNEPQCGRGLAGTVVSSRRRTEGETNVSLLPGKTDEPLGGAPRGRRSRAPRFRFRAEGRGDGGAADGLALPPPARRACDLLRGCAGSRARRSARLRSAAWGAFLPAERGRRPRTAARLRTAPPGQPRPPLSRAALPPPRLE